MKNFISTLSNYVKLFECLPLCGMGWKSKADCLALIGLVARQSALMGYNPSVLSENLK